MSRWIETKGEWREVNEAELHAKCGMSPEAQAVIEAARSHKDKHTRRYADSRTKGEFDRQEIMELYAAVDALDASLTPKRRWTAEGGEVREHGCGASWTWKVCKTPEQARAVADALEGLEGRP